MNDPWLTRLKRRGIRTWRGVDTKLRRFGPHLTDWALPDGRTLTVAVTGFRQEPVLRLRYGTQQIEPTRVSPLSDDPGTGNWQLVFDCPHPDTPSSPTLELARLGKNRPLRSQPPSQPDTDRAVRDASWPDGTRWVQVRADTASWQAAAPSLETTIERIDVRPGIVEITATNLPPSSPATLLISCRDADQAEYSVNQGDDGSFHVATPVIADTAFRAGLNGTSNWDVSIQTDTAMKTHLRFASRDLINPNTAIVYQPDVALVSNGRVAIKPYWSARGFLRILLECTFEDSTKGAAQ